MSTIKNVIFDLGGVPLPNIDYNRTTNAFKQLGYTDFENMYSMLKGNNVFDNLENGPYNGRRVLSVYDRCCCRSREQSAGSGCLECYVIGISGQKASDIYCYCVKTKDIPVEQHQHHP